MFIIFFLHQSQAEVSKNQSIHRSYFRPSNKTFSDSNLLHVSKEHYDKHGASLRAFRALQDALLIDTFDSEPIGGR